MTIDKKLFTFHQKLICMLYILIGQDNSKKDAHITKIKQQVLPDVSTHSFDFDVISALKLDPDEWKKALVALPAAAPQRLLVVRNAHKFLARHQDILFQFLEEKPQHVVIILDSYEWEETTALVKKLKPLAQIISAGATRKRNPFDMTRAMERQQAADALQIMHELFAEGNHPLQIMGSVLWYWGKQQARVGQVNYEKGLLELQKADECIKRSRMKPEYALEKAVISLLTLQA